MNHVFVGAHGDEKSIYGAGEGPEHVIPVTSVVAAISEIAATRGSRLEGIYFSSCRVGRKATAGKLLVPADGSTAGLKWVAGYSKDADWVASAAVDLFFGNKYLEAVASGETAYSAALGAAEAVGDFMPGAVSEYGFNVFVREHGDVAGVLD